ncbi:MAG: hypothetical protein H6969_06965 [Gammaproteobacteria bacterium]|nr:hypothetical protein [Gammaproteobacteria bacterium]MCP5460019.1 hypothetical protein [Gammaproteobacteria bacterium]
MTGEPVWIGTRVIVLPGVLLGNGAVVGAGAVVPKFVTPADEAPVAVAPISIIRR